MDKKLLHEAANGRFDDILATNTPSSLTIADDSGHTLYHWAAAYGRKDVIDHLKHTAPELDINQADATGATPRDFASHHIGIHGNTLLEAEMAVSGAKGKGDSALEGEGLPLPEFN